ncbi:VOC family protein [Amycolatopsis rhabdoformis]|uniref:VOC family protein n=1 Tax=Amycolatopsis rhabdoformis TaxID=1448059 RepID=A0ABZ1IDX8_9PSEU|nr:VOC family protein [Amycolatopsis rhabdoformis]WSE32289.1 VOC family protein [Amycolatopsis rhabdoformis]
MPITLASVIIDAADLETESAFWCRLLDGSITRTPTHHFIQAPGLPVVVIQSAPGHLAPNWPDGTSQQLHLDFGVEDLATADRTAIDAGATRLRPTDEVTPETGAGSRVYASPAGHPFCLRAA